MRWASLLFEWANLLSYSQKFITSLSESCLKAEVIFIDKGREKKYNSIMLQT